MKTKSTKSLDHFLVPLYFGYVLTSSDRVQKITNKLKKNGRCWHYFSLQLLLFIYLFFLLTILCVYLPPMMTKISTRLAFLTILEQFGYGV